GSASPSSTSCAAGSVAAPAARAASSSIKGLSASPRGCGSKRCARPRTASASQKRTCGCAAKATCWARGRPGFRFARLEVHGGLLARAREEARSALDRSERLTGEENRGLRLLLYLFERDEAARLIEAG